jgi:hypothetical protein
MGFRRKQWVLFGGSPTAFASSSGEYTLDTARAATEQGRESGRDGSIVLHYRYASWARQTFPSKGSAAVETQKSNN